MSKAFQPQKDSKGDKTLARYVFEARFTDRLIPFFDQRGQTLEKLLKSFGLDRYVINDDRIEATDSDQRLKVFFSSSNFGFQLEGSQRLEEFSETASRLISVIQQSEIAKGRLILRFGTKSEVYFHPGGKSFADIKDKYLEKIFVGISAIESAIGATVGDVGVANLTLRDSKNRLMGITTGPMEVKQITSVPFFSSQAVLKNKSSVAPSGIYLSIDLSTVGKGLTTDDLGSVSDEQINSLNESIEKFTSWLME